MLVGYCITRRIPKGYGGHCPRYNPLLLLFLLLLSAIGTHGHCLTSLGVLMADEFVGLLYGIPSSILEPWGWRKHLLNA